GSNWELSQQEAEEFAERTRPEQRGEIAEKLGQGTRRAYRRVRELAPPMLTDRTLDGDIRSVRAGIEGGSLTS
ncbi:MAG TPA: hypothetical protein VL025_07900, partial [Thermoanaerobaculia bacterium]|nr:hypothetical protein [Thermoanaerobaculia bacterium]